MFDGDTLIIAGYPRTHSVRRALLAFTSSLSETESTIPYFVLQIFTNFSFLAWRNNRANRWRGEGAHFLMTIRNDRVTTEYYQSLLLSSFVKASTQFNRVTASQSSRLSLLPKADDVVLFLGRA